MNYSYGVCKSVVRTTQSPTLISTMQTKLYQESRTLWLILILAIWIHKYLLHTQNVRLAKCWKLSNWIFNSIERRLLRTHAHTPLAYLIILSLIHPFIHSFVIQYPIHGNWNVFSTLKTLSTERIVRSLSVWGRLVFITENKRMLEALTINQFN